ncbi:hypothetical protein KAW18_13335 [candidate division WOR-3 bacterium]|nr:hypothetical protein [candidate division WOR-3 bacterium]
MKKFILLFVLMGLLFIVEVKGFQWIPGREGEELLFFPSGRFVNGISSGFENILADFIWIEAGVYYGGHRMTDRRYPYLYHILDVLTDLDPYFISAYTLGAALLSDDVERTDLSMDLLNKGIYNNPTSWEIPFIKGFIHYIYTKDYHEASRWFLLASKKEDAPDMVFKFATWTMVSGKGVEVALRLWLSIYYSSKSLLMKEKAIKGLTKILRMQALRFEEDRGYFPHSLSELKKLGYIPFIPYLDVGRFVLIENEIRIE